MYTRMTDAQFDAVKDGDEVVLAMKGRWDSRFDVRRVVRRTQHQIVVSGFAGIKEVAVRRFGREHYLCPVTDEVRAFEAERERRRRIVSMVERAQRFLSGRDRTDPMPPAVLDLLAQTTDALEAHNAAVDATAVRA